MKPLLSSLFYFITKPLPAL